MQSLAINDPGQIVGFFEDSSFLLHGFLRDKDGTFSIIDIPGAVLTEPHAINDPGDIVGREGNDGFLAVP
jgi:probable HAF family extracellular repeat protein